MKRIAIFASGSGSNAQKIIEHFDGNKDIEVSLVLTNNENAYVLQRASDLDIPAYVFDRQMFYETDQVHDILRDIGIDFIVLAGFLWLVPLNILRSWPNRIVNIHPALLPKFGGKGMFGERVHEAVIAAGEKETGISIHYVNEVYDEGEIIFQEKIKILPDDTPDSIAERIHVLEHKHFPEVIEKLLNEITI
ncbi:MAG: phosphoribosylglycinamide formyltransferase [Bacteroidetes bacterium]|nr:MAG: phosphoribosylglycinamide formyltransferase [Bacteroidota bacterium]RLD82637.1 MAG: phosphoribosylglycinamide formyltransferase [Bacteroidota bacterium]